MPFVLPAAKRPKAAVGVSKRRLGRGTVQMETPTAASEARKHCLQGQSPTSYRPHYRSLRACVLQLADCRVTRAER